MPFVTRLLKVVGSHLMDLCSLRISPLLLKSSETKQTVCVSLVMFSGVRCSCALKPDIVAAEGADRHHAFGTAGRQ